MTGPGPTRRALTALRGRTRGGQRGDAGVSAIEAAILAPAILAILAVAIVAMRIEVASQSVESAAHDAARAASISRTEAQAMTNGVNTAKASLAQQHINCLAPVGIDVRAGQFGLPVGQVAVVTVTIVCNVSLSGLGLPGLPGIKRITATFTSDLDRYRGRT